MKRHRPKGSHKISTPTPATPTYQLAKVRHGYFKSFDGTRLFYSQEGEGLPLVFCYGLVCSSLHWTYQIEHFSRNYKTIWFDYRGHQNSDKPKDLQSMTISNIATDLRLLLEDIGIKKAVFLGHSMGVNVVLETYRQNPDLFAGMLLSSGTARAPLESIFGTNLGQKAFELFKRVHRISPGLIQKTWNLNRSNPIFHTLIQLGGFNPHLTPKADIELYVEKLSRLDPSIFIHLFENYEKFDAVTWMDQIHVPTMIVGGALDKVVPVRQQELMHQLIPGSRLEIIKHGSHCPQMDLPEFFNTKVEQFLESINYKSSTPEVKNHSVDGTLQSIQPDVSIPTS